MADKKTKKQRGVLARLMNFTKAKTKKNKKPAKKYNNSHPAGGYANPKPREKRLKEVFDFGLRKKKD